MAKRSLIERNKYYSYLSNRDKVKRDSFLEKRENASSISEYAKLCDKLRKTRKSTHIRVTNRCSITGRPRGNLRFFGICRGKVRELASSGWLPGVIKSN